MDKNTNTRHHAILLVSLLLGAFSAQAWQFNGAAGEIKANLDAVMAAEPDDCSPAAERASLFGDSLLNRLTEAVAPFGYFQAEITVQEDPAVKSCKGLVFDVVLNEPTRVALWDLSWQGEAQSEPELIAIVDALKFSKGDVLHTPQYQKLKSQLVSKAQSLGYLDSQFDQSEIEVNETSQQAQVRLVFDSGPLYHVGQIIFNQTPHFMNDALLSNMVRLKPGHVVKSRDIQLQLSALNDSNYFSQVSLKKINRTAKNPEQSPKINGLATVDLLFEVQPAKRIHYSIGLGYATDTGPRTTLEYRNDRVGKRAWQFKSQAKIAQTNQDLSFRLKIPSPNKPLNQWYLLDLGYLFEDIDRKQQETDKISISQNRSYSENWQNANFIDITNERFGFKGEAKTESLVFVPGVTWTWRQADDWIKARRGVRVEMTLQGADEALLSDVSFVQAEVKSKFIHGLGDRSRMIYHAQLGATHVNDFDKLPFSYRFYSGGDRTVRGYDYESLSPEDASGDLIGGKHVLTAGVEFEYQINEQWSWAVFTDAGNAFNDDFEVKHSAGLGIRWLSPLGPIRLDAAQPLNDDDVSGVKFHFTVGPDF